MGVVGSAPLREPVSWLKVSAGCGLGIAVLVAGKWMGQTARGDGRADENNITAGQVTDADLVMRGDGRVPHSPPRHNCCVRPC